MQTDTQHGILAGLPQECPKIAWTDSKHLKLAANEVLDKVYKQDESGNQYLVILDLSKHAIGILLDEKRKALSGIKYRFTFEGSIGVIKLIPSFLHDCTTENFREEVARKIWSMGLSPASYQWGGATTHPESGSSKAKEPDQCFWPSTRPRNLEQLAWPTLVMETGLSESLPRLREDAYWWFSNSGGNTRVVLLFTVQKKAHRIVVEKWQLAPSGSLRPYCAQELTVTPMSITGAPLVISFEALMDRAPVGNETDLVLDAQDLTNCAMHL